MADSGGWDVLGSKRTATAASRLQRNLGSKHYTITDSPVPSPQLPSLYDWQTHTKWCQIFFIFFHSFFIVIVTLILFPVSTLVDWCYYFIIKQWVAFESTNRFCIPLCFGSLWEACQIRCHPKSYPWPGPLKPIYKSGPIS